MFTFVYFYCCHGKSQEGSQAQIENNVQKGNVVSACAMLTWNSWIHMTMPNLASGTKVQTGDLLGSSIILICSEQPKTKMVNAWCIPSIIHK